MTAWCAIIQAVSELAAVAQSRIPHAKVAETTDIASVNGARRYRVATCSARTSVARSPLPMFSLVGIGLSVGVVPGGSPMLPLAPRVQVLRRERRHSEPARRSRRLRVELVTLCAGLPPGRRPTRCAAAGKAALAARGRRRQVDARCRTDDAPPVNLEDTAGPGTGAGSRTPGSTVKIPSARDTRGACACVMRPR